MSSLSEQRDELERALAVAAEYARRYAEIDGDQSIEPHIFDGLDQALVRAGFWDWKDAEYERSV